MPEGIGYSELGSQYQFSSAGPLLNVIKNKCYGYSGQHTLNNSSATHFEFTTGKYIIEGMYQITFDMTNMDNNRMTGFDVYFNDVLVVELKSTYQDGEATVPLPLYLTIPPLTTLKIVASTQLPSNLPSFGIFTGTLL